MSTKKTAEKMATAAGARADRLKKKLSGVEGVAERRTLKKRVKRAQRARRRSVILAAGGAKAGAKKKSA